MDPVTAAGLAVSIASLALQLLGGCIKGYEIFLGMSDMPSQYEHLRVRMRLEQSRLLNWGEKVGLLEETLERPSLTLQLHRNVIIDILSDMQRLFKDCLKIQTQIDNAIVSKNANSVTSSDQLLIQVSEKRPLLERALKVWEKSTKLPTRLQWALVKQEKFERTVEKLIGYNDSIVSLLDRTTIQQLYDMQVQSQMTMLQLTSKIDDLQRLAMAIQVQTNKNLDALPVGEMRDTGGNEPCGTSGFARLASFKAQQMILDGDSGEAGASLLDRDLVHVTHEKTIRALAVYQRGNVWVEWKEYDPDNQSLSEQDMIKQRVQKLATLLSIEDTPEAFTAPHCVGYIHDIDEDMARYGLVYSIPNNIPEAEPLDLLNLIQHRARPSLTQRIGLANTITSSLMYLHSVNWLHKGIRSENIVFFVAPGQKLNYTVPIISGFEYARPDLPEELTEKPAENFEHDLYRHPDALGRSAIRSKKSWDFYSIGVVLIEIALWRPIGDIIDLHANQRGAWSRLRKVKEVLLQDEFLERVCVEIGGIYQDVVRRCIAGGELLGIRQGMDETEPETGANMQRVVLEHVVGKLRSIHV